ncbi:purine-nucleoside phosphorylase [Thermodesulfobacteriota bacterium]
MKEYKTKVTEAAQFLRTQIENSPEVGLLTGTGLGESAAALDISRSLDYSDIPNFPVSTVETHFGRLLIGRMAGKNIIAMQGRFHLYEGYSSLEVTFPIRVMQALGVKVLILSNASGGLNLNFTTGDIMVISDHINLTGANPLVGPNEALWGKRFPDMTRAYDEKLSILAAKAGKTLEIPLQRGVYVGLKGPSLETPAEVRFLKTIGAEAVGFSTVLEVIAAVHAGIRVLGLSIITNINDPDNPVPATVDEIIAVAKEATPRLEAVIKKVVESI